MNRTTGPVVFRPFFEDKRLFQLITLPCRRGAPPLSLKALDCWLGGERDANSFLVDPYQIFEFS